MNHTFKVINFFDHFINNKFELTTGDNQPSCGSGGCSHSRAHALFAETIISSRFVSTRCDTLQQALNQACTGARGVTMGGEPGNVGLRGLFHLRTNGNSPFAMGWSTIKTLYEIKQFTHT